VQILENKEEKRCGTSNNFYVTDFCLQQAEKAERIFEGGKTT